MDLQEESGLPASGARAGWLWGQLPEPERADPLTPTLPPAQFGAFLPSSSFTSTRGHGLSPAPPPPEP